MRGGAAYPGSLWTVLKIFTEIFSHRATLPNKHSMAEPLPSNLPPSHEHGVGRPSRIQVETLTQSRGTIFEASLTSQHKLGQKKKQSSHSPRATHQVPGTVLAHHQHPPTVSFQQEDTAKLMLRKVSHLPRPHCWPGAALQNIPVYTFKSRAKNKTWSYIQQGTSSVRVTVADSS